MPQAPGNHGIRIPRDRTLLFDLYWNQEKTLPQIAEMFDVNHKSVLNVFRELKIPTRRRGQSPHTKCIECGEPVFKIRHTNNGSYYGRRCKPHFNAHKAMLLRAEIIRPGVRDRRKQLCSRWYYDGPLTITGEKQWLQHSRRLLRRAKRILQNRASPAA